MEPGGHLKKARRDIHLSIPVTFQTWKGFILMGFDMFNFNAPLKFPYAVPCIGFLLIGLVSIAFLPDRMGRPLATAYKSVKSQTQGLFSLFNSSITARKTACSSVHQADLCLISPNAAAPHMVLESVLGEMRILACISFLHSPCSMILELQWVMSYSKVVNVPQMAIL